MPGYLRLHIQTIFPGPKQPEYAGESGWYWVEITFQPNPIVCSEVANASLRNDFIGDSLLVISDPLPVGADRKHVFTIKARRNKLEYFVYCNGKGHLSHINAHLHVSGFTQAIECVYQNVRPFLSGWSLCFNVPIHVLRIRALEDSSKVVRNILYHQLYDYVRVTESQMNRIYHLPEDNRIISFYHDALNATSPKYQFMCYYKAVELSLGLRARKATDARNMGEDFARPKEILQEEDSFVRHLSPELQPHLIGKKYTTIRDDVLRPLRNRIAHGLLEETEAGVVSDDEVYPYLPVVKLMAERLIASEIGQHVLPTNQQLESDTS